MKNSWVSVDRNVLFLTRLFHETFAGTWKHARFPYSTWNIVPAILWHVCVAAKYNLAETLTHIYLQWLKSDNNTTRVIQNNKKIAWLLCWIYQIKAMELAITLSWHACYMTAIKSLSTLVFFLPIIWGLAFIWPLAFNWGNMIVYTFCLSSKMDLISLLNIFAHGWCWRTGQVYSQYVSFVE